MAKFTDEEKLVRRIDKRFSKAANEEEFKAVIRDYLTNYTYRGKADAETSIEDDIANCEKKAEEISKKFADANESAAAVEADITAVKAEIIEKFNICAGCFRILPVSGPFYPTMWQIPGTPGILPKPGTTLKPVAATFWRSFYDRFGTFGRSAC